MDIKELGYLVLGATDLQAWRLFANEVLGAMARDIEGLGVHIRMDERDCRILLLPAATDGLTALGWLVTDERAFLCAEAAAVRHGCEVCRGSTAEARDRRVQEFFHVQDPAGVRHEVAWGPVVNFRDRFISPAGFAAFTTGDHGLGHVVLGCPSPVGKATHEFWQDVLGLAVSNVRRQAVTGAEVRDPITWYHCANPRQHSLGLVPTRAAGEGSICRHVNIEVPTIDDVGLALDRAERHGTKLASTLGRHINDRALSFYMVSPGGFWIEYGCDSPPRDWSRDIVYDDGGAGNVWGHRWLLDR